MNRLTIVLFLVVCSCTCAVLGTGMYGIAPVGYGMGYGGVSVGSGMFGASGAAGFGGIFETLIHLFLFVFIINLLFSNGGGLLGGQKTRAEHY
ncbi:hypothetical protein DPMN_074543 [Dreissena polymorpha]|uniref:Uncharacterized protein n=1 Tax=Dreissena polymorpha TaxID=45954 RepID=A0A9D4BE56_DREPO|nr:hypothetical protein DPMN_074543 [Dreissena polymorpha]